MKTHAKQSIELDHLNLAPVVKTEVSNLIQALQNELKLLEAKNQALMLELAHLRRIRYGAKSEALSQVQFSLFEEDWQTDVAAIEAEIEQLPLPSPQKPNRPLKNPALSVCILVFKKLRAFRLSSRSVFLSGMFILCAIL